MNPHLEYLFIGFVFILNVGLIKVRSVYDALATGSLVLMSNCSCGSTRGFDELVPHHISVVEETRTYSSWEKEVNLNSGIIKGKMMMNNLHSKMSQDGFSQIYVDQFDGDTTVVTRHNSITHESYILVSRTSFYQPNEHTSVCIYLYFIFSLFFCLLFLFDEIFNRQIYIDHWKYLRQEYNRSNSRCI